MIIKDLIDKLQRFYLRDQEVKVIEQEGLCLNYYKIDNIEATEKAIYITIERKEQ